MKVRIPAWIRSFLAIYGRGHVPFFAAALAYYALFSLLPLVLLLVGVFGFLLQQNPTLLEAFKVQLEQLATTLFPASTTLAQQTLGIITKGAVPFTLGSILALAWTSSNFFSALSYALSTVFGGTSYWMRGRALGLAAPLVLGLGVILFAVLNLGLGFVGHYLPLGPLLPILATLLPYLGSSLLFFLTYRFLPKPPPGNLPSIFAALGIGLAWEALRRGLPLLLPRSQYEIFYGPLAGFLLALLGLYLAMWLLLVGAVVLASLREIQPTS